MDKTNSRTYHLQILNVDECEAVVRMDVENALVYKLWSKKKLNPEDKKLVMNLIDFLYTTALNFEFDHSFSEKSDLEAKALYGETTQLFMTNIKQYFKALFILPYDSTSSLQLLLDYLCTQQSLENRSKAVVLKMGLFFINPYARIAWYILHSSLLYTFETFTRLRKSLLPNCHNLYYRDISSFQSGPNSSS